MPEISRFYGIIIRMFYNDHNPPHFHAIYGNDEALINIQTLEYIEGKLPKRARALVTEWAIEHREELVNNWEKARKPEDLLPIDPLN
ncbi:DUF4160 domain-containing protein [Spirosoma foliorum]|uniref:DUF4160 domain-containing protein n=1 Tax=Spirosoma foliorum TaxID=2710596 RepID=A0A7G5GV45_9BACT|nr:DUF4160 domain-containing protein [Spirosoma foliorum]QMW02737.1 DUF4160 domain-containing protein [Spirosoma foliorum]